MGTTRTFNDMLNQYLPDGIFEEELAKRDYVYNKVEKITDWKGGEYQVPFRAAGASSVAFAALTSSTDIAESQFLRGTATQKEVWGSLIFNQRDLQEHDGKIPESTFLRILPDEVDHFMQYIKEVVSVQLTCGPHFAKATEDGGADGTIKVDKVERFQLGQKVILDDDNSATQTCYVIAINLDDKDLTVSATRGGAALDISAYTLAQNAKFYHPGATTTSDVFTSMRAAFLSSANGGDSSIHGKTKATYPILQAYNKSGATAGVNATNILDVIFDTMTEQKSRGRGMATSVLMSYKHLGSVMKILEVQRGGYRAVGDPKANVYGWTEISVQSVKGTVDLVGLSEFEDDVIMGVDWSSMKFGSNGTFKKRKSPSGNNYFEVRNTTGYQYIVDVCLFGEMLYHKLSHNWVLHSIPNY